jgi:hypothetical protein
MAIITLFAGSRAAPSAATTSQGPRQMLSMNVETGLHIFTQKGLRLTFDEIEAPDRL